MSSRILLGSLALLLLVGVCYLPSVGGDFLWDDDSNVSRNPTIRTAKGLQYIWTKPHSNQQYYPLTHSSFWVEYQLWELWPTGYRITNLLLHAGVALLLWAALRRLAVPGAWVAAAIFALHPVHVESVAWITERKNLLSAVLYFAALLASLKYMDGRKRGAYIASLLLFVAALLAKTAILTLPAALLVIVWWRKGKIERADWMPTLPMFGIGALFGAITWWLERGHVGASGPAWDLGLVERVVVAGRALWFYATKTVLPFGLNFIYPRWSVGEAWQIVFPIATMGLLYMLWRSRDRIGRGPLAGVLYFGLTVAPALGFLDFYFQIYAFVQDHFQYVASIGLIVMLTAAAAGALQKIHPRAGVTAAAAVLLLFGGMSWQRSGYFTSEQTLWNSVLERNPDAWMAHINLGLLHQREGRPQEAESSFEAAIAIDHPEKDKAHYNLGQLYESTARLDRAQAQYEKALEINPEHADANNNLGNLMTGQERYAEAIEYYRAAIRAVPTHATARYNLALRLAHQGDEITAERELREALRIDPGYLDAADWLGRILSRQQRYPEAIELYRRVLILDPNRSEVHYNHGFALEMNGDLVEAEKHYRRALALDPNLAQAHNNLAIILYNNALYAEAWKHVALYEAQGGIPHPGFLAELNQAYPRPAASE